jgi:hypothetical protein
MKFLALVAALVLGGCVTIAPVIITGTVIAGIAAEATVND